MTTRDALRRAGFAGTVLFGGLHALASLYWGLGGRALLDTVGRQAVEIGARSPWLAAAILLPVAVVKAIAIAVPILNDRGRLPWPRSWRVASWVGAAGLVLYGTALSAVAAGTLASGRPVDDRPGMIGHAYLWDPLFALWGISLLLALAASRRRSNRR